MAPLIEHGDYVVVEALTPALAPGAIVVAHNTDGELVCHRVLKISDVSGTRRLWLSGDRHGVLEAHDLQSAIGRICAIEQSTVTVRLPEAPRTAERLVAGIQFFALRRRGGLFGRGATILHRILLRVVNRRC